MAEGGVIDESFTDQGEVGLLLRFPHHFRLPLFVKFIFFSICTRHCAWSSKLLYFKPRNLKAQGRDSTF